MPCPDGRTDGRSVGDASQSQGCRTNVELHRTASTSSDQYPPPEYMGRTFSRDTCRECTGQRDAQEEIEPPPAMNIIFVPSMPNAPTPTCQTTQGCGRHQTDGSHPRETLGLGVVKAQGQWLMALATVVVAIPPLPPSLPPDIAYLPLSCERMGRMNQFPVYVQQSQTQAKMVYFSFSTSMCLSEPYLLCARTLVPLFFFFIIIRPPPKVP